MTTLEHHIADLPDDQAITALALALERHGQIIDPFDAEATETRMRQALLQPDVTATTEPDQNATRGALARTALQHLARDDEAVVTHAITITPGNTRFDPGSLAIGALVLMAFRADINLERDPDKGWSFHFRTKPLNDSTIGKLLGQLLNVLTDPGR
jgi:hypothetical protein